MCISPAEAAHIIQKVKGGSQGVLSSSFSGREIAGELKVETAVLATYAGGGLPLGWAAPLRKWHRFFPHRCYHAVFTLVRGRGVGY